MAIRQQMKEKGHDQTYCLLLPFNCHSFFIEHSNYVGYRAYK